MMTDVHEISHIYSLIHFTHRRFYTGKLLRTEAFTHRNLHTRTKKTTLHTELLHRTALPRRSRYAEQILQRAVFCIYAVHTEAFKQKTSHGAPLTQKNFQKEAPLVLTHRSRSTEKLLHKEAVAQRSCYALTPLHTAAFTQRSCYTEQPLHTDVLHTEVFTSHRGIYT